MANDLQRLGDLLQYVIRNSHNTEILSNQLLPTFGTVIDTEDPERRGRVKVILDEVNPLILEEYGYEQGDSTPTETDWIEPLVPFRGIQPKQLMDQRLRVPITARNGDPNRLAFGDPIYDASETNQAVVPQNSAMTRLPVYPSGQLPEPTQDNLGCMVVEQGGPQGYDWLCVCLNRGGYKWVRHIDLKHTHASQQSDSRGDSEGLVNDDVSATT
jgi:hypothetical protein